MTLSGPRDGRSCLADALHRIPGIMQCDPLNRKREEKEEEEEEERERKTEQTEKKKEKEGKNSIQFKILYCPEQTQQLNGHFSSLTSDLPHKIM